MSEKCKAVIQFGDDFGDNVTTFRCDQPAGHKGKHQEHGDMGFDNVKVPYLIEWEGTSSELPFYHETKIGEEDENEHTT